jgi:hypothetical protein
MRKDQDSMMLDYSGGTRKEQKHAKTQNIIQPESLSTHGITPGRNAADEMDYQDSN